MNTDTTKIPFSELDDKVQDAYVLDAFNALASSGNEVPYGLVTGDDGDHWDYQPACDLAEQNYNDED
jgi:hypothetical protein